MKALYNADFHCGNSTRHCYGNQPCAGPVEILGIHPWGHEGLDRVLGELDLQGCEGFTIPKLLSFVSLERRLHVERFRVHCSVDFNYLKEQ